MTQRGNGRQYVLAADADRLVYLELLRQSSQLHEMSLLGYCLMSNHVHLVVIPRRQESLALALKQTHGRYASYFNAAHGSSGHVWQGRFYSCPLDASHLWEALRYSELNPVRAGMVAQAEQWPWSSAAAHCRDVLPEACLEMKPWSDSWTATGWREYLEAGETDGELNAIRQCTHTGRPLGAQKFVESLEQAMGRQLAPQKGGRPLKPSPDERQESLFKIK